MIADPQNLDSWYPSTTMVSGTPSYVVELVRGRGVELALVEVCGEALTPSQALALRSDCPNATILNLYGPTETTVDSVGFVVCGGTVCIGRPIDNTLCYVVHPNNGILCPPGVAGELWIGGAGVARGYHNRSDLTAAKFVPNPFSGGKGRVYKTGDRVQWNA